MNVYFTDYFDVSVEDMESYGALKQNLAKQVEVYKAANQTKKSIKVILYFSDEELIKVQKVMRELDLQEGKELVLIDAQTMNKLSGSNVKCDQVSGMPGLLGTESSPDAASA